MRNLSASYCASPFTIEQLDLQRIKRDDMEVIEYLKSSDTELYKSLKKAAKAKKKAG